MWFRGVSHPLRIIEMRPNENGVLLDTDVEVELDNSLETKVIEGNSSDTYDNIKEIDSSDSKLINKSNINDNPSKGYRLSSYSTPSTVTIMNDSHNVMLSASTSSACSTLLLPPTPIPMSEVGTEESRANSINNTNDNVLPNEPDTDDTDSINIRVRTSSGSTFARRFLNTQPFMHLFYFASSEMNVEKKMLQLSTRFPNRVFTLNEYELSNMSFVDVGITSKQEIFLASIIM